VSNGSHSSAPTPSRESLPTCINGLDALPPDYSEVLASGLPTIPELEVTSAQLDAIGDHVRLLLAWNAAINLTAIRTPDKIALEHVLDSLTGVPLLRRLGVDEFLEIGSGGGFPGLPVAIALGVRRALLVESIGKKARFLATVTEALELTDRVRVAATRAETLARDPHHRGHWGTVIARAVTNLSELAELSMPLLRVGGHLVAWKRLPMESELAAADGALYCLGARVEEIENVTVAGLTDHVLVSIVKTVETPPQYPREPAARVRHPL
jgi:16S rRNA (guanine527-N7)-methyltransferase